MKTKYILILFAILVSCSNNKGNNADSNVNNSTETTITNPQEIISRVEHIYSVVLSGKEGSNSNEDIESYFSKEHHAIGIEGASLTPCDWGAECDFWTLTMDYGENAKLTAASIDSIKNDTAVVVKCTLNLDMEETDTCHIVYLTMIKEDGKWVADDNFDGSFSYKQCNLDAIRELKEDLETETH